MGEHWFLDEIWRTPSPAARGRGGKVQEGRHAPIGGSGWGRGGRRWRLRRSIGPAVVAAILRRAPVRYGRRGRARELQ